MSIRCMERKLTVNLALFVFREKSSILSGLLSPSPSPAPQADQTLLIPSDPTGQTAANISNLVKAKKSAGVGSGPRPCGLQCKRIKQVRLVTAITVIYPCPAISLPSHCHHTDISAIGVLNFKQETGGLVAQCEPSETVGTVWTVCCNNINSDEILSSRLAGATNRQDQRLQLNVITPAKRKRARLESSRLRAPNTISQSSLGTRNEGRRVSTSSRRK